MLALVCPPLLNHALTHMTPTPFAPSVTNAASFSRRSCAELLSPSSAPPRPRLPPFCLDAARAGLGLPDIAAGGAINRRIRLFCTVVNALRIAADVAFFLAHTRNSASVKRPPCSIGTHHHSVLHNDKHGQGHLVHVRSRKHDTGQPFELGDGWAPLGHTRIEQAV